MQNTRVRNLFSTILGAGVVAGGLVLSSCEDEFTEQDAIKAQQETLAALKDKEAENAAMQDSLNRIGAKINYTVTVVADGGSANTGRTAATASAEGATVTLTQGGKSTPATAGKGGVATFVGLLRGQATITIEMADHTPVTYTTTLGSNNTEENNVGTVIPVFPITEAAGATVVKGKAWAELNTLNDTPEPAEGAIVRSTINIDNALSSYQSGATYGRIETATYTGFKQETTVDSEGNYTLVIPNGNGKDGQGFASKVEFLPYEREQTYVMEQGDSLVVMTEMVVFDPNAGVTGGNHIDESLPNVFVKVGAPTGNASGMELVAEATRTAFTSYSSVLVDGRGKDYTAGDRFNFSADKDGNAAFLTVNVDGSGAITSVNIDNNGAIYDAAPTLTPGANVTGTGAALMINFRTNYNIKLTNGGSGYWEVPEVSLTYDYYDNGVLVQDAYDDNLSANIVAGKVQDSNSDGIVENIISATAPKINIAPMEARQAVVDTDEFEITEQGRLEGRNNDEYIYLNNADRGNGYVTNPTVTIKSVTGETTATGVAVISNGEIDYITITNPGSGFVSGVNTKGHSVASPKQHNASPTFKPSTVVENYNFFFGAGATKK